LRRYNNVGGVMHNTEHLAWLLFHKFFDQQAKKRAQEIGAAEYLGKPFEIDDLINLIDKYAHCQS
jgi:DNA-binding response OmpR family regulator